MVQESLAASAGQKPGGSTATQVKTFKFHHDGQVKAVQAAIDKAKKTAGAPDDPEALVFICNDYVEGGTTLMPDALAAGVAYFLENLDKVAAA